MRRFSHFGQAAAFAMVLLLAAAPARLAAMGSTDAPDMAEVQETLRQGDYQKAIGQLIEVVNADPTSAEGFNLLGYSYRKLGEFDRAKQAYDKALALNPDHLGANEYLGELYVQTGQLPLAEAQLAKVRTICGGEDCEEYEILSDSIAEAKEKAGS
jgi:Flp pilus assembly protein TadD